MDAEEARQVLLDRKRSQPQVLAFDPDQPRDPDGRWGEGEEEWIKKGEAAWKRHGPPILTYGSLTQAESMSKDGYLTPEGNRVYNDELRKGPAPGYLTEDLDSAIAKTRTKEPCTVYRGVATSKDFGGFAKGQRFSDKGYTSATTDEEFARSFAGLRATGAPGQGTHKLESDPFFRPTGGKPVVLAINVPAGHPMMRGDSTVSEVVMPHGETFVVNDIAPDGTVQVTVQ
jgi:hypothetical protein